MHVKSGDLARGKYMDIVGNFTSILYNEKGYT